MGLTFALAIATVNGDNVVTIASPSTLCALGGGAANCSFEPDLATSQPAVGNLSTKGLTFALAIAPVNRLIAGKHSCCEVAVHSAKVRVPFTRIGQAHDQCNMASGSHGKMAVHFFGKWTTQCHINSAIVLINGYSSMVTVQLSSLLIGPWVQ